MNTPERIYMSHHGVATIWPENAEPAPYIRSDLYAAAIARAEAAEALLKSWLNIHQHCSITDGVCCCGDDMNNHPKRTSNHTPYDHGSYEADKLAANTIATMTPPDNIGGNDDK